MATVGDRHTFGRQRGRGKKLIIAVEVQRDLKHFDCGNCLYGRACETGVLPEGIRGWEFDGVGELHECPRSLLTTESTSMLRLFPHYFERGIMPFAGGLMDQPNGFVQAMEIIAGVKVKRDS